MQEHESLVESVAEQMPVLDRDGSQLGTVSRIYRRSDPAAERVRVAPEMVEAVPELGGGPGGLGSEGYLEVDTGTPGERLFVPSEYVVDVTPDGVKVNAERGQVEELGWGRRPSSLEG